MRTVRTMLALLATLATIRAGAAGVLPASGEFSCVNVHLGECDLDDSITGMNFRWPRDWPTRRLDIVTESGPSANARLHDATRWLALQYLPDDPTEPAVLLFEVSVLRRTAWIAQSMQSRLVTNVEVATGKDYVAVASVPSENPYPSGSRDADIFEALQPSIAEISRIVRLDLVECRGTLSCTDTPRHEADTRNPHSRSDRPQQLPELPAFDRARPARGAR